MLHVVSPGDRLAARTASATHLTRGIPGREMLALGETGDATLDALRPGHMELVTDSGCEPLWDHVGRWVSRRATV